MHDLTSQTAQPIALARPLRAMLVALALVAMIAPLLIVINAPRIVPVERHRVSPSPVKAVPPAVLPPVEPALFVPVAPDDARAINASVPFSTAPKLGARPFRIVGGADSIARATDCLAAALLYEAGDEPVGQRAVAQVVLNRVRHPAFPKTICGVVFQGAERRTGCQFTFTCDGALARRYSDAAWGRARDVADAALAGHVDKSVGMSTHYHTEWVVPYWSASLDKVSAVQGHLFFRWTGWWGTPGAFRGRYRAEEPRITRLNGIAPSHSGANGAANTGEGAAQPPVIADAVPKATAGDPDLFLVTLDPRLSPADWAAMALAACGTRPYCKLMAWSDRADTPTALPADARRIQALAFSYLRDRRTGFDKALWDCARFKRASPGDCMKPRILPHSTGRDTLADTPPSGGLAGVRRRPSASPPRIQLPATPE